MYFVIAVSMCMCGGVGGDGEEDMLGSRLFSFGGWVVSVVYLIRVYSS